VRRNLKPARTSPSPSLGAGLVARARQDVIQERGGLEGDCPVAVDAIVVHQSACEEVPTEQSDVAESLEGASHHRHGIEHGDRAAWKGEAHDVHPLGGRAGGCHEWDAVDGSEAQPLEDRQINGAHARPRINQGVPGTGGRSGSDLAVSAAACAEGTPTSTARPGP